MSLDVAEEHDLEGLRFGSHEWDAARSERRGHPTGSHIREEPDQEQEVVIDGMVEGPDFDDMIKRALGRIQEKEPPDMPTVGRWLPSDWGSSNTLTLIAMLIGFGVTIFGGYSAYRSDQDKQNQFNTETLSTLRTLSQSLQDNTASDRERTARYAPQIEMMTRNQDVSTNRIENMVRSLQDIRDSLQEYGRTVMQDHTDVQVLKSQMQEHAPQPRSN